MKTLIITLIALFAGLTLVAQSNKEDIEIIQSIFGKEKKSIVDKYMGLSGDMNAKFWTIYDEYESARRELGKERIAILQDYANKYTMMDDAIASDLAKRTLQNDVAVAKMHEKYFKKIAAATNAITAAKFLQLETYLQNVVRLYVQEQIPFIGELDTQKIVK